MEGDGFFCICLLLWGEGYPFAGVAEEGGFPGDLRKRKGRRRGICIESRDRERKHWVAGKDVGKIFYRVGSGVRGFATCG